MSVLKFPLLVVLQQKVGDLVLSVTARFNIKSNVIWIPFYLLWLFF
jgi:hypothetical protein